MQMHEVNLNPVWKNHEKHTEAIESDDNNDNQSPYQYILKLSSSVLHVEILLPFWSKAVARCNATSLLMDT